MSDELPWARLRDRRCRARRYRATGDIYWGRCELKRDHEGDHALERGFDWVRWADGEGRTL